MTLGPQFSTYRMRDQDGYTVGQGWVHNETGQTAMFSPETGTGMHDDPINSDKRRLIVSQMMKRRDPGTTSSEEVDLWETVNRGKVPLQHLADAQHSGLRMSVGLGRHTGHAGIFYPADQDGRPRIDIDPDPEHRTDGLLVAHELGHARHQQFVKEYGRGDSIADTSHVGRVSIEGIADGYGDMYGDRTNPGYGSYVVNSTLDDEIYQKNRQAVASSKGVMPLKSHGLLERGRWRNAQSRQARSEKYEQTTLDL